MSVCSSAILSVTEAEFDSVVLASKRPVVVDFWAPWCGPCKLLTPMFEKFAREFSEHALFVKINRDEATGLRARYQIDSIPRMMSFAGGVLNKTEIGLMDYPDQRNRVKTMLGLQTDDLPSDEESQYSKIVEDAFAEYFAAIEETQKAVQEGFAPIRTKASADTTANDEALAAGSITQREHDDRANAIESEADHAQAALKPLLDAYYAASATAEAAYTAKIDASTDKFFPLQISTIDSNQPASTTAEVVPEGAFCAIGDTTCGAPALAHSTAIELEVPGENVILFYKQGDLPYGVFSNFAIYKISVDNLEYGTSEIYFQAKKFEGTHHEEEVRMCETSRQAADMGRDRSRPLRADWDSPMDLANVPDATTLSADWERYVGRPMLVKDYFMLIAVRAKFDQHIDLHDFILSTEDAYLIEHTKNDNYWADGGDGTGQNMLGKILMIVRLELARRRASRL